MHFNKYFSRDFGVNYGMLWIILLNLTLLFLSCNMNGYNDLRELVNQFTQFGSEASTYMRTLELENGSGVELFTINGDQGQCCLMDVFADNQEVTVTLQLGTYKIFNDKMDVDYFKRYINTYKRNSNPSEVPGAAQHDISPQEHVQADWELDAAAGIINIDNACYKRIDMIFENIFSQASPNWVDQILKMYHLYNMSVHARIEGFGGGGMLQYLEKTTVFDALLFGTLNFTVTGLLTINSRFTYKDHGELSGMILNGTITNESDMNGNGEMSGTVAFTIQGVENLWQGSVYYSDIDISHTLPSSGEYLLTIEGQNYTASYDYGNPDNFDLTDILDPDPVNW